MSIDDYLSSLEQRVKELGSIVVSWSIQREIDTNLGVGLIRGRAEFIDGSRLEFTEQLPVERRKFRLHYMDSNQDLLMRWDSAPHHKEMETFPFHVHTPDGVEAHGAITLVEALDKIAPMIQV